MLLGADALAIEKSVFLDRSLCAQTEAAVVCDCARSNSFCLYPTCVERSSLPKSALRGRHRIPAPAQSTGIRPSCRLLSPVDLAVPCTAVTMVMVIGYCKQTSNRFSGFCLTFTYEISLRNILLNSSSNTATNWSDEPAPIYSPLPSWATAAMSSSSAPSPKVML